MGEPSLEVPLPERKPEEHLDSWKEIAAYLNRDVTTVQRWEKREGMPVHRHLHDKRGSVYAIESELDAWRKGRKASVEEERQGHPSALKPERLTKRITWLWAAAALVAASVLISIFFISRSQVQIASPTPIRSVAVLPLRNLSGDSSQDYFSEGMTEALIDRLSSLRSLRVTSHTSVMRFKDPQISVPDIARTLGVDAIVEGSVMREGNRIRVTAQLIRGATDEHFWSQTYDRELRDALTLESELAQSIAEKVQVTVTGPEHQRLAEVRPVAPEVYESYLKGRFALSQAHGRAEIEQSIVYLQDALKKDGTFVPAYLALALAYRDLGTVFAGAPKSETTPKEISAAQAALKLDPDVAEAHVLLAEAYQEEWLWSQAEAEFRRAIDLSPNDAGAYEGFAMWLLCQGHKDEALAWITRARELDPIAVSGNSVSWILFQSHKYDEAIREARSELAVHPGDTQAQITLGFVLAADSHSAEAIPPLEKAVADSKGSPAAIGVLIRAYARAGRRNDALRFLAELKRRNSSGYVPAAAFVNADLGLGDTEQAFVWLEKAYDEHSNILQFLKTHPYFDPIRGDPRFKDLVHRVGLD